MRQLDASGEIPCPFKGQPADRDYEGGIYLCDTPQGSLPRPLLYDRSVGHSPGRYVIEQGTLCLGSFFNNLVTDWSITLTQDIVQIALSLDCADAINMIDSKPLLVIAMQRCITTMILAIALTVISSLAFYTSILPYNEL